MKRKILIFLSIFFLSFAFISFSFWHKEYKVEIDFENEAYSYLPESAKEFIKEEAKKGTRVLTEKNKEPGQLYLNPNYVNYLTMSAEEKSSVQVIPEVYTWDNDDIKKATATFPTKYSLVDANLSTKVKNQSTLGICWAFATYSSIETNILVSGLSKNEVNFAERQIDYAMSNRILDINNPYALEGYSLGQGSNFTESSTYLNVGISPVEESIWGDFDNSYRYRNLGDVLNTDNVNYQVTSYVQYGTPNANASETVWTSYRNLLKEHIQKYGSLYVVTLPPSYAQSGHCYDEDLNLITDDGTCYSSSVGYHALAIVGWDDNYAGGAWILKNSWGEYNTPYTYLSYDSLYYDVSGITGVKIKNWDNVYDFTKYSTASTESKSYAITYEKDANFDEYLERISFTHLSANGTYKVYLKNNSSSYSLIKTVTTTYPGLSTVELGNVSLEGETFSIKIVAESGVLGNEISAFTSNTSNEPYTETYKFNSSVIELDEQLIVRNVESGTKLDYYIYDLYGNNYATGTANYVINGTYNVSQTLSNLASGDYYLTLDEDFYEVSLSDEKIELDIRTLKTGQISINSNDKLIINSIKYASENTDVVTIDANGTITATGIGQTKVKAIINDKIERICDIIVGPFDEIVSIKIKDTETTIYRNFEDKLQLSIETYPSNLSYDNLKWKSSNTGVATIDANGLVTALKDGKVTITATLNGLSDSVDILIKSPKTSIILNAQEKKLNVNQTFKLLATSMPELSNPLVKWTSTNENVATVSNSGLITAISNGFAKIILNVNNDEYMAQVNVYVINPNVYVDLEIDPNGGTYKSYSTYKYQKNSLSLIELETPLYEPKVTLIYNYDSMPTKTFTVNHEFDSWINEGDGVLNNNTYKVGFENSKLTAKWNYNFLNLPDLSNLDSKKIFVGWYSDAEFKSYVGKNIDYKPLKDTTLYAYWAEYKTADVNSDLVIDITDLVVLRKHLAEITTLTSNNLLAADINHDGNVDITDLIILRKYLAGLEEIE